MFKYTSAIFFGATLGVASLIPLQAATNHFARNYCADQPLTHKLVNVGGVVGDSYFCVANQYL